MYTCFLIFESFLIFLLAGVAVRLALVTSRGFDLLPTIVGLLASESTLLLVNSLGARSPAAIGLLAILVILLIASISTLWPSIIRLFHSNQRVSNLGVFIFSLGASSLISGIVGYLRGPGVISLDVSMNWGTNRFGIPVKLEVAIVLALMMCAALLIWMKSRIGFAYRLSSMNEEFANEIGITRSEWSKSSIFLSSACAGVAGVTFLLSVGSSPNLGMQVFLYGVGVALLVGSDSFLVLALVALCFSSTKILSQLYISPAWSESIIYIGVVLVLIFRGLSRDSEEVR